MAFAADRKKPRPLKSNVKQRYEGVPCFLGQTPNYLIIIRIDILSNTSHQIMSVIYLRQIYDHTGGL